VAEIEEAETEAEEPGQSKEPKDSKGWLDLLEQSEKAFSDYQAKCDSIDKLFGNLTRLASDGREREFQLFWANMGVLGPSVYSRPPVPVVTTRFKDRDPLKRTAAEMLERVLLTTIEQHDLDGLMLALRDDVNVIGRGVPWARLGEKNGYPCVYTDHVDRRDFRHDPVRRWGECDWVARCAWLTRGQARKRFFKTSGNAYKDAAYSKRKDTEQGNTYADQDSKLKAPFWELWSKSQNKVVWVTEGVEKCLDEGEPYLELENFFPCPEPCYATLQRNTLIPIPDVLFYKDQLEEIDQLTGRIAALGDALKVKGFYPSGAGNISDAIEAAIKSTENNVTLVPVANWNAMGNATAEDMVLWWPIEQVASTIKVLVELRKQLIDDVYQIVGLSDIMRGSTKPSETLGAQELKSQYGSVRIRDRQGEIVRVGRDIIRIAAEIIAENYDEKTLLEMSQMELPSNAEIMAQVQGLKAQSDALQAQTIQQIQQAPQEAQAIEQQAQQQFQAIAGQIEKLAQTVTQEKVIKFLRDNRMRCFNLDIETDSTIAPDENAQKQRATEYVTAMSGFLQQAVPAAAQVPQIAPLMSEMIQFVNKQFRIGRSMEQSVEEFADQMKQMASQPKPDPNAAVAEAEQAKIQLQHEQAMADKTNEGKRLEIEGADKAATQALNKRRFDEVERPLATAQISKISSEVMAAGASVPQPGTVPLDDQLKQQQLNHNQEMHVKKLAQIDTDNGFRNQEIALKKQGRDGGTRVNIGKTGKDEEEITGMFAEVAEGIATQFTGLSQEIKNLVAGIEGVAGLIKTTHDESMRAILAPSAVERGQDGRVSGARKVLN
jgi:hypothetical protein